MPIKFSQLTPLTVVNGTEIVPVVDVSELPITNKQTDINDIKAFTLQGNAASASKFSQTVNINGVAFDGSADIAIDNTDNVFYVTPNGSNTNDGKTVSQAFASIQYACTQATGPSTIRVAAGTYTEQLPIIVPSNIAIIGDSIRTTIIQPAVGYEQDTMFLVGDGAILNKMHFIGLTGFVPNISDDKDIENATLGGVYVAFDPAEPIINKSPYIIECTAKSSGGIGAIVDGSVHLTGNKSMVFHGYTIICDNGLGYWIKDNAKAEIVSCFTYYCHAGYVTSGGGKIRALNGNNSYGTYGVLATGYNVDEVTLDGTVYGETLVYTNITLVGSFSTGDTITGSISGATGTVTDFQPTADKIYYKLTSIGTPFQANESVSNGLGASATLTSSGVKGQNGFILVISGLSEEPRSGASIEIADDPTSFVIQSVSEYEPISGTAIIVLAGEKALDSSDGAIVTIRYDFSNIRLTGHDFLNIGTGGLVTTNYPGVPIQAPSQGNEVIELFPARVFYVSTDQDGNFRVGEYFRVDQATGRATLNASAFDLSGLTSLRLGSIGAQVGELINEFSSDTTLSGNSNLAVPTEAAVKSYFTKITSNVVPGVDNLYNLGSTSYRWLDLNLSGKITGPATLIIDPATINDDTGLVEIKGSLSVKGTDGISTSLTTFPLINTTATTVNFAGAATALNIGAGTGTSTFNNDVNLATGKKIKIAGNYGSDNKYLKTTSSGLEWADPTVNVIDDATTDSSFYPLITTATSGTVTTLNVTSSKFSFNPSTGKLTVDGEIAANGGSITTNDTTFNLINTTATTVNFAGAATQLNVGAATGKTTFNHDLNIAENKVYKINDVQILSNTTLASSVINSSLTSVGTLTSLSSGAITTTGTLAVNASGGITTNQTTFPLINTTATTVNFAGAATAIVMASTSGTTQIRNTLNISGDLNIDGNVTVGGNNALLNATNVAISDNLLYLNEPITATVSNAVGNGTTVTYTVDKAYSETMIVTVTGMTPNSFNVTNAIITAVTDTSFTIESTVTDSFVSGGTAKARAGINPDLGIAAGYDDGTYQHTGLFRDASDGVWKFFDEYLPEPDESLYIDITDPSFAYAPIHAAAATFSGAVAANHSSGITTNQTTFPLVNSIATTVNFAGAATTLNIGAATGTTTINNNLTISGSALSIPNNLNIDSNTLFINSSTNRIGIGTATPDSTVHIVATDNIVLPTGDTSQRGTANLGSLRYNSELGSFEGYTAAGWGSIGGSVTTSDTAPPSPTEGKLWWNSALGKLFVYYNDGTSTQWVEASPNQAGLLSIPVRQTFTATGGQTTFTVSGGYTPSAIDVFLNGVKLVNGVDVTVSSGTDVVLATGASAGAVVEVVGLNSVSIADTLPISGGSLTGDLAVWDLTYTGTLTGGTEVINIGNGQIYKGQSGNVGIGTADPQRKLHIYGQNPALRIETSESLVTGGSSTITFGGSNNTNSGYIGFGGVANRIDIWNNLSGNIVFGTSNTTAMTLDSSGNLSIGTPSALGKLTVAGNVAIGGSYIVANSGTTRPNLTNGSTYRLFSFANSNFARNIEIVVTSYLGRARLRFSGYSTTGQQSFTVIDGSVTDLSYFITETTNGTTGEIRVQVTGSTPAYTHSITVFAYDGSTNFVDLGQVAV